MTLALDELDGPRPKLSPPSPEESGAFDAPALDLWQGRQEALVLLGFDPGTPDGKPGPKTRAALEAFQRSVGLVPDGVWGPKTRAAIADALGSVDAPPESGFVDMLPPHDALDASMVLDLTAWSPEVNRKATRAWSALERIVWHQTGFAWTPARQLRAEKRYSGHHKINSHICIDTDGTVILIHPLPAYLWTANAFNRDCISVEIMGNFEGVLGHGNWYRPDTFGRHRPRAIQLQRARALTEWLDNPHPLGIPEFDRYAEAHGAGPLLVNAHRNATDDRDIDPGSEIWFHVCEWAISRLGLKEGSPRGRGRSTPDAWRQRPAVPPTGVVA